MTGEAQICVWADRELQDSTYKHLTFPDNLHRTSDQTKVLYKIFFSDSQDLRVKSA